MQRDNVSFLKQFFKSNRTTVVFGVTAVILIVASVLLLVRYHGLKEMRSDRPEEYGAALQQLDEARDEKTELEKTLDQAKGTLAELTEELSSYEGN